MIAMSASFDTLTYAKKLKEAGFTDQQAEAQADALRAIVNDNLATKHDIEELRAGTKQDIALVQRDIKELETRLGRDIAESKADLLKWMVGLLIAQGGLIVALVRLI